MTRSITSSRSPRLPVFSTLPCRPAARAASFRPRSALAVIRMAGVGRPWRRSSRTRSVPRPSGSRWSTSSRSAPRRAQHVGDAGGGGRRAAQPVARATERGGDPVAHDGVVVHEQDADLLARSCAALLRRRTHCRPIPADRARRTSRDWKVAREPLDHPRMPVLAPVRAPGALVLVVLLGVQHVAPPRAAASAARRTAARRRRPGSAGRPRPAACRSGVRMPSTWRSGDWRHSAARRPRATTASPSPADDGVGRARSPSWPTPRPGWRRRSPTRRRGSGRYVPTSQLSEEAAVAEAEHAEPVGIGEPRADQRVEHGVAVVGVDAAPVAAQRAHPGRRPGRTSRGCSAARRGSRARRAGSPPAAAAAPRRRAGPPCTSRIVAAARRRPRPGETT